MHISPALSDAIRSLRCELDPSSNMDDNPINETQIVLEALDELRRLKEVERQRSTNFFHLALPNQILSTSEVEEAYSAHGIDSLSEPLLQAARLVEAKSARRMLSSL